MADILHNLYKLTLYLFLNFLLSAFEKGKISVEKPLCILQSIIENLISSKLLHTHEHFYNHHKILILAEGFEFEFPNLVQIVLLKVNNFLRPFDIRLQIWKNFDYVFTFEESKLLFLFLQEHSNSFNMLVEYFKTFLPLHHFFLVVLISALFGHRDVTGHLGP